MSDSVASIFGYAEQLNARVRSASDKNLNDLYYGLVVLPGTSRRELAYVKVFPADWRGQLVFNELVAYQLALQCALPMPLTFPCACRKSMLRRTSKAEMLASADSDFVVGIASVDAGKVGLKQHVMTSEAQILDLLNWPHVARTAVFDELLGNDDRHLGNLVRRGLHDYALIDNERIMFAERWFGSDIESFRTRRCDSNVLADTIGETTDELMKRRMIFIAQQLMLSTTLTAPSMCEGVEEFCGAPIGTTVRLVNMLNSRRTLLSSLMQWHLQKGDLFLARTNQ